MPEGQTVAAESSPAIEAEPTFDIPRSGTPEYVKWRTDGTFPDKTQPEVEESAPSGTVKEPQADSGESPAPLTPQERTERDKRKSKERWDDMLTEQKRLKAEIEALKAPKPESQSKPAEQKPAQPRNYQEWRKNFKAAEWVQQHIKDNPETSYEDANAAMADHLSDVRDNFRSFEQQQQAALAKTAAKVKEAEAKYENFKETTTPFIKEFLDDPAIPLAVKMMAGDSEVWTDLVFTIASDPQSKAEFLEMAKANPGKALRYIAKVEALIGEELDKGKESTADRDAGGKFVAKKPEPQTPAKRGPESAPEPPLEIGNRGSGPMDESERALKAAERGDPKAFSEWRRAEDKRELARRRG